MDIRSLKQGSWLSLQTGRPTTGQASYSSDAHCHQPLHSTPEVELPNATSQKILHYNLRQIQLHQMSLQSQTHQMPCQNQSPHIDYKHYYKHRELIHFVNALPSLYQMAKHQTMKPIFFYTSRDYCMNMLQIQTRSSWLLSYLKHGNTQCSWKHMTCLVTRELLPLTTL